MVVLDFLREKGNAPMRIAHQPTPSPQTARGFLLALAGLLVAVLLLACSAAAPTPTPTPTAAAYPLTLTGDDGKTVTIAARPQKIVSLTPAATETLFALG